MKGEMGIATKEQERIQAIAKSLDISLDEAREVYTTDEIINHDPKELKKLDFDLSPSQRQIAQLYTRTGTRQVTEKSKGSIAYQFAQPARKADATKSGIISELADFLANKSEYETSDLSIVNPEREVQLRIGGAWYKITLTYCRNMNKAEKK